MRARYATRKQKPEAGIALLISIFILLLISVVAISLIVSSGTESALAGNYRSSTSVYYAALAGIEEARGRLQPTDPNSFKSTAGANFLPPPGTPFDIGYVSYVLNPGPTDVLANMLATYPDAEYDTEFGGGALAAANGAGKVATTVSVWNRNPLNALPVSGPLYKWVRINAVSEVSLGLGVAPFDGHARDPNKPVFYDGTLLNVSSSGGQVLEITSLAVLPNGSQKLLQYLVIPSSLALSFPSALTLDGPIGTFASSFNSNFWVSGIDQQRGGNCPPAPAEGPKPAIGVVDTAAMSANNAINTVINGIPPYHVGPNQYRYNQYVSSPPQPTNPSVGDVTGSLVPAFQSTNSLDGPQGLVQTITALADHRVAGPANTLPDYGDPSKPVTTVVEGDLSLPDSANGYGLLLVTGTLTMDGNAIWNGIILVIGQGELKIPNLGNGFIYGAVLIANTRSGGSLRAQLGAVTFDVLNPNNSNNGFWYNSCWINKSMPAGGYRILSFHEIAQ